MIHVTPVFRTSEYDPITHSHLFYDFLTTSQCHQPGRIGRSVISVAAGARREGSPKRESLRWRHFARRDDRSPCPKPAMRSSSRTWETKNEEGEWGEGVTEEGYPVGEVRRARRGRNWRSPSRFPAVVPILTSSLPPPARRAV